MDKEEYALALTRAWGRTNGARRLCAKWRKAAEDVQAELTAQHALVAAADVLADAARNLPDVVKTKALQTALSKYRKARQG